MKKAVLLLLKLCCVLSVSTFKSLNVYALDGQVNADTTYIFTIQTPSSSDLPANYKLTFTFPDNILVLDPLNANPNECQIRGFIESDSDFVSLTTPYDSENPAPGQCGVSSPASITLINPNTYPYGAVIKLGSVKNPYAVLKDSSLDPFTVECHDEENNLVYSQNFDLEESEFSPDSLSLNSTSQTNKQVGVFADYTIEFHPVNNIPKDSRVRVSFSDDFELRSEADTVISGHIDGGEQVTMAKSKTGNVFYATGLFSEELVVVPGKTLISITISDLKNPEFIGTSNIDLATTTSLDEEIDIMSIQMGAELPCDIVLEIYNPQTNHVLREGSVNIMLSPGVYVPKSPSPGYITLEFPPTFTLSPGAGCRGLTGMSESESVSCEVDINKFISSPIDQNSISMVMTFYTLTNPPNSKMTEYFKAGTYTSQGNLVCESNQFHRISADPNPINIQTNTRNSSVVGELGPYTLVFTTSTKMPEGSYIKIVLPKDHVIKDTEITCRILDGWAISGSNSCSVEEFEDRHELLMEEWCSNYDSECASCCSAGNTFSVSLGGVKNPLFVNPGITSSVQVYSMNPSRTGVIDQIVSGLSFTPELVPQTIEDGVVSRVGDVVAEEITYTFSFTPITPFVAGTKIKYTFPQGAVLLDDEGTDMVCTNTGTSFGNANTPRCQTLEMHSDGSVSAVTIEEMCPSGCTEGVKLQIELSNIENRVNVVAIGSPFSITAYTAEDWVIETGNADQTLLNSLVPNEVSNFVLERSTDKIKSSIYLDLSFDYKTEISSSAQIEIELPVKVATIETSFRVVKLSETRKLSVSSEVDSVTNSVTKVVITDYCTTQCPKNGKVELRLEGLKTLEAIEVISGKMSITTSLDSYTMDTGSVEDVSSILNPLTPGDLYNVGIHPYNPTVSASTDYRVIFTTEHSIPSGSVISIELASGVTVSEPLSCSSYLTIDSGLQCSSSGNTIEVTNGFPNELSGSRMIGFWVGKISNGGTPTSYSPFKLQLLSGSRNLINKDESEIVTFYSSKSDSECQQDCEHCAGSGSNCYSCEVPSTTPLLKDYTCITTCPEDHFLVKSDLTCIRCHYTCGSCLSEKTSECVTCASGFKLSDGYCLQECPSGTTEVDGICTNLSACTSPCTSCSFSSDFCLECDGSSETPVIYPPKGTCNQLGTGLTHNCPETYFEDTDEVCKKCSPNCEHCVQEAGHCTSCPQIYSASILNKLDNTCVETCPELVSVYNSLENTCEPCHESCATCKGTGEDKCLSCPSSGTKYFTSDSRCLEECPQGVSFHYENTTSNTFHCIDTCYEKHYVDEPNNYCRPCMEVCLSCEDATTCSSCDLEGENPFLTPNQVCRSQCDPQHYEYTLNGEKRCYESECPSGSLRFTDAQGKLVCILPENCPSEGYYVSPDDKDCFGCHETCLTCSGSTETDCLTCDETKENEFLTEESKCVAQCPPDQYSHYSEKRCLYSCPADKLHYDVSETEKECIENCYEEHFVEGSSRYCIPCHLTCKSCSGPEHNECITCKDNYSFLTDENECVSECAASQYRYTLNESKRCYSTCPSGTFHFSNETENGRKECISICGEGYFVDAVATAEVGDNENHCKLCYSTCKSCEGPTSTDCLACDQSGFYAYFDYGECTSDCGSKFKYEMNGKMDCRTNCPEGTLHYDDPIEGLVCIEDCPFKNYIDAATDYCRRCYSTCESCEGGKETDCTSCDSSGTFPFLTDAGECRSKCSSESYVYTVNGENQCFTTCPTGTFGLTLKNQKTCVAQCPEGYFSASSRCQECYQSCSECSGSSSNECTQCEVGYIYFSGQCLEECPEAYRNENGKCVLNCQQSTCLTCDVNDLGTCSLCKDGYALHEGYCYSVCPTGFYKDNDACKRCHENCRACSGGSDAECTYCGGEKYYYRRECLEECPEGLEGRNNKCQAPCQAPCKTCQDETTSKCTSCTTNYPYLHNDYCFSECPEGHYGENGTCMKCNSECYTCEGPESTNCLSCYQGTYLNPDRTCQAGCPDNLEPNSETLKCEEATQQSEEEPEEDVEEEETQEAEMSVFAVYILIVELLLALILLLISKLQRPDTHYGKAIFYFLTSIVEFSSKLLLVVFLWVEGGPGVDILVSVGIALIVGSSMLSLMFNTLHFDPLTESSATLSYFVSNYMCSYQTVKLLSVVFGIHFVRIFYSGFCGCPITTNAKTLGGVSGFRFPLERLSFFNLVVVNLPQLLQQVFIVAFFNVMSNSWQIALFGLTLNSFLSCYFLCDWIRGPWRS